MNYLVRFTMQLSNGQYDHHSEYAKTFKKAKEKAYKRVHNWLKAEIFKTDENENIIELLEVITP